MQRAILAARSRSLISDSSNSELLFSVEIRNMGTDTVYVNARIHGILTRLNALSPERVRQQQAEIDAVNSKLSGIRVFKDFQQRQ